MEKAAATTVCLLWLLLLLVVSTPASSPPSLLVPPAEAAENSWTTKEPMPTAKNGVGLGSEENPPTQWIKDIGSFSLGGRHSFIQTADGGYAMTGGKDEGFLLLKTNSSGDVQWEKTYGTEAEFESFASAIVQAEDGGYVLAGRGTPWPNFIGPNGTLFNLVKTDSAGNMQWNRSYSTEDTPFIATSLIKTSDRGYAVAGYAEKGHSIMSSGTPYACLVKTDGAGNMQWKKQFGIDPKYGIGAISVVETDDGGYAILTLAVPTEYDVDFRLINTDSNGNMQWSKTYGGTRVDLPEAFIDTADGGYLLAGFTQSFGVDQADGWLVKTDSEGNMLWDKTYGGIGWDAINSVLEANDGGYIVAAMIDSSSENPPSGALIFKTDTSGNTQWTVEYQGVTQPALRPYHIIETADGGYVFIGSKTGTSYTETFSNVLVKFTSPSEIPDTTPPTISIVSPENKAYGASNVSLTFTLSEPTLWRGYSLDSQANVTIHRNITLTGLSDGTHSLTVYARDRFANTGASETVYFTIAQKSEPFPTTLIVATTAIIAVVGAALLAYFVKVRKTTGEIKEQDLRE